jgi:Predicted dinucleotide-utilizing enzyme
MGSSALLNTPAPVSVGLIGYGAIGRVVADALSKVNGLLLVGLLVRDASLQRTAAEVPDGVEVTTQAEELLAKRPQIVVECAGHAGLHMHAETLLRGGADLLIASVGALADASLESRLRNAAAAGGSRMLIPAGAIAGLDALGAARMAGLDRVDYTGRKAPTAWRGTRVERLIDLEQVTTPTVFFEGSARQAALDYPQNANVVAAVALAGLGFDRTRVRLMVDPGESRNQHSINASGAFGELSAAVIAETLADNPKTSKLAPWSLVRALQNVVAIVCV